MPNHSAGKLIFPAEESFVARARRFHAEGRPPAPARRAATVPLLRPDPSGGDGFEVYLIRRAARMTFGGMYAFPGGSVDPADSSADLDWAGPGPRQWGDRLGLPPAEAQALVCAAAREVFEEAGVLLAGPHPDEVLGDVSGDDWERCRQALVDGRTSFADLLRDCRLTLRSDLLLPWSRWVTPEFEARRFDTYFFVALLPEGQLTRDVSGEADQTRWLSPADAVARADAGELTMLPPTRATLREIADCVDLAGLPAAAARRDPTRPLMPRLESTPDGGAHFLVD
ncbi:NUDIX hydrolase [Plantactinospora sonchi]|uniref:NUDIX hydrolase n=1 Tax=Plantactinospora sonchi TaxID=1544735 RepID=A0ABU7RRY2_9ACTN